MRALSGERSIGDLDRYKPSGWRRDLVFIIGCYYAAQVGSVAEGSQPWESDCQKFLGAMEQCWSSQWLDIKELHPLDYMGYVASVFMETTGHYLSGLSNYTGWIRPKSYYHWKVAELGQMDLCAKVRGQRLPRGPITHPSIKLQWDTQKAKEKAREAKDTQRPEGEEATMGAGVDDPTTEYPMEVNREPPAEAGGGDNWTWYDLTVEEENKWLKEEVQRLKKDKLGRAAARRQMCPGALPPQQMTTEVVQATPYKQQVFPPPPNPSRQGREARTQPTTTRADITGDTPSSSAPTETSARGRARERESHEAPRHRSSTRGSRKRMRALSGERSIGDLDRYKPSGWRRDLVFIIGCYYAAQVGSVAEGSQPWESDCQKFLDAMEQRWSSQWLDIKELHPLDYMGYVASVFMETTGHYLSGLSNYTGWIRPKSYYHWKVAELGQMDLCAKVRGQRLPRGPITRPSIKLQWDTQKAKEKAREAKDTQRPEGEEATMGARVDDPTTEYPMEVNRETPAEAGGGDNWTWYDLTVEEENKWLKEEVQRLKKSLDKCPSPMPATRPTKPRSMEAIYADIAKSELPRDNIAFPAIQAYYPKLDYGQVRMIANHVLAMVTDYHTSCVVNGPSMAYPVSSPEVEEKLPQWKRYKPPAGTGQTDVRVADGRAKTLRVAVWLHRLDMALNSISDASRSLIPARHL